MEQDPHCRKANPEGHDRRAEHGQSFDLTSGIYLIRHDLKHNNNQIYEETMDRVRDEELTYIAEGIDRRAYTSFTLRRGKDGNLIFFDQGEWRPYMSTLTRGLEIAKKEAAADRRRDFLSSRAVLDLTIGYQMLGLKPGEAMVWSSPFPEAEYVRYGADFIQGCGFKPDRKMGFLYRAFGNEDGSVTLESHTIDNSEPEIFAKVEAIMEYDPQADLETLIRSYDGHMRMKYGGQYRAGRRVESGIEEEDAYAFLVGNKDLLDYYFGQIVALARQQDLNGEALEKAKHRLTLGVWARVKELLNEREQHPGTATTPYYNSSVTFTDPNQQFAYEIQRAFNEAQLRNDMLVGCGGAIGGKSLEEMSSSEALDAIFGEDSPIRSKGKETYAFDKKMFCVSCQAPPKHDEPKKMCGPCGLCEDCDAQFED